MNYFTTHLPELELFIQILLTLYSVSWLGAQEQDLTIKKCMKKHTFFLTLAVLTQDLQGLTLLKIGLTLGLAQRQPMLSHCGGTDQNICFRGIAILPSHYRLQSWQAAVALALHAMKVITQPIQSAYTVSVGLDRGSSQDQDRNATRTLELCVIIGL